MCMYAFVCVYVCRVCVVKTHVHKHTITQKHNPSYICSTHNAHTQTCMQAYVHVLHKATDFVIKERGREGVGEGKKNTERWGLKKNTIDHSLLLGRNVRQSFHCSNFHH